MLGLRRHIVKLVPHQENWKNIFESTKEDLYRLIGDYVLDIQHVGSTSIIGIPAKPIIDVAIAIENASLIEKIIPILEKSNYLYRGNQKDEGGFLFVKDIEPDVRSHHIHIVEIHDLQWKNYLLFRDRLNANPELAKAYSVLKNELAKKYVDNRGLYTASKYEFIQSVIQLEK